MKKYLQEFIATVLQEKIVYTQDMKCPKCKTVTHADDVGHTNYYECPKCHYRWSLTETKIRKNFGEPLVESNSNFAEENVGVIIHVDSGSKLIVWDEYLETKIYEEVFAIGDFEAMLEAMRNNKVAWVQDLGMEEPVRFQTWLQLNSSF